MKQSTNTQQMLTFFCIWFSSVYYLGPPSTAKYVINMTNNITLIKRLF
jgi:hypothetical protein